MRKNVFVVIACAGAAASSAFGQIAYTSFEEPAVFGGQYVDTGDPLVAHALINNVGEPLVNYTSIGGELGFSAFDTPSAQSSSTTGLSEGDFVGVTDFTGTVGAYTHGLNGYEISDADGLMTVSLDTVNYTGTWNVSIDYYLQDTGYEADDRVRIWATVDGGVELDILAASGDDIKNHVGAWTTGTLDLSSYTMATLHFELDSNAASEALFVDNIVFAVPTPGTLALTSLGLVALGRRRR